MSRRGRFFVVSALLLAACSSSTATPTSTTTAGLAQPTTAPVSGAGPECRNALLAIDAYVVAKQSGTPDVAAAAAARGRCLASTDVPPSCADAMALSVTIGKVSADSVEFLSSFTAYGEASTLCRLKLLKSI